MTTLPKIILPAVNFRDPEWRQKHMPDIVVAIGVGAALLFILSVIMIIIGIVDWLNANKTAAGARIVFAALVMVSLIVVAEESKS